MRRSRRVAYAEVLRRLRKRLERRGSQRALAAKLRISQSYLSDIVLNRRRATDAILKVIGLCRVEEYHERRRRRP